MSNKKIVVVSFLFLLACFAVMPATANGDGDTISVTVAGIGRDADAALKDALRSAVEQAIGSLVDAKTLVENDKLVQDKILTFSGGFVKSYKQLGEPNTRADGLVSVRIAAEVKRGELDSQLRETGVTQKSVDWQDLYAERLTKMQSLDDGIDMLKWIIEEYMLNCITVKEGGTRWDQEKRKVVLEIQISVDYDKYSAFVKRFTEVLKKMGVKYDGEGTLPLERMNISYPSRYSGGNRRIGTKIGDDKSLDRNTKVKDSSLYIATSRWRALPDVGGKKQEGFRKYSPPLEVFEEIRNSLITVKSKSIVVELLDDESRTVAKDKVISCCPCYVDRESDKPGVLLIPSLFMTGYTDIFLHWGKIIPKFFPGTPEYKEEIYLDIPMDDMRKISSIQFRYEGTSGDKGAASSSGDRRRTAAEERSDRRAFPRTE